TWSDNSSRQRCARRCAGCAQAFDRSETDRKSSLWSAGILARKACAARLIASMLELVRALRSCGQDARAPLQPYIFKLERLALDASSRRRHPVGDLANFGDRLHQTPHVFAIFYLWQPFRLLRFELVP